MGIEIPLFKYSSEVERDYSSKVRSSNKIGKVEVRQNITYNINLPAIPSNEVDSDKLKKIFEEGIGGFVKNKPELLVQDAGLLSLKPLQKEILKDYRGAIDGKQLSAMRTAFTIMNFEDNNFWKEASELRAKLGRKYKMQGKRMYNLCRSGYIDGKLRVDLHMMMFECQGSESYKLRYQKYFNDCMEFFPYAVWANEWVSRADMISEINKRIIKKRVPEIKVFARGKSNIERTESVTNQFVESELVNLEQRVAYDIGRSPCVCLILKPIKIKKNRT